MIDTIALVIVLLALCALLGWVDWNNRKERSKLINALMAKTPEQLRDLEFVDKVQPPNIQTPQADLIAMDALDDDQFDKMIKSQIEQENEDNG